VRLSGRHRRDGGAAGRTGDRCCSRAGCPAPAVATLTYVYAASTAVVGPLAGRPEPHGYDLCQAHARGLTAPRGWELVRHDGDLTLPPRPDDLTALAEAVREPSHPLVGAPPRGPDPPGCRGRRSHLRVVPPA
jgi:hypothetical protein